MAGTPPAPLRVDAGPGVPVDFERLIETERRNDDILRQAREEAAGLCRAAQLDADRHRAEAHHELADVIAAARARTAARRDAALATILAESLATSARFDQVADQRLAEVVTTLIADLLDPGSAP